MISKTLFADHLEHLLGECAGALELSAQHKAPFGGIVFHAGSAVAYHADDQDVSFHTVPHFARLAPVPGPDHLVVMRPGHRFTLYRVVPRDYWYEPPADVDHPYAACMDVVPVESAEQACEAAGDVADCGYVGSSPTLAARLGIGAGAVQPAVLVAALDWSRGQKTPYEVECIREAARIAARGHAAVRRLMAQGESERALHAAYLEAAGMTELESPYGNIIAWDDRSAILHYQSKRTTPPRPGAAFLIDAGAMCFGYASDVTRTYARNGVHPVFRAALDRVEAMQRELVAAVAAGKPYLELHVQAHRGTARILSELGIVKVDADTALAKGHTRPFLPHGLGHHLGLQVHDIGGRQATRAGGTLPPPAEYPYLRTTRALAPGHVVTIEPGLYFIPMLLAPLRDGPDARDLDWRLIDALLPMGGIRVEDDVLVTPTGREDLTRPLIPGHLEG
jgi:Xaa-Pro dipeptidase